MALSPTKISNLIVLVTALAFAAGPQFQMAGAEETPLESFHLLKEMPPNDIRISDMGTNDGNASFDAFNPVVAYDSVRQEYLVIWDGDDDTDPLVNGEFEIFGQRLSANGARIDEQFQISFMGPDGDSNADARDPALAFNDTNDEFLAVWESDPNEVYGTLVANGEFEIFGQLLAGGTMTPLGADFRISRTGADGSEDFDAMLPAVAFNSVEGTYLVVWQADPGSPLASNKTEIFGQLIAGITGDEIGVNFRISITGSDSNPSVNAENPAAIFVTTENLFLVVWQADDPNSGLADNEYEIFAQFLDATTGFPVGGQLRISDMGPDGTAAFQAANPTVAYDSTDNQILVTWNGDDDESGLINDEIEIFGQFIDAATRTKVGGDFRITHSGPDGETTVQALNPDVIYDTLEHEYVIVWEADDSLAGLVNDEFEIFLQRLDTDGVPIESSLRLSDMGPDFNPGYDGTDAAIAYNSRSAEFLVVWEGDDSTGDLADGEFEIFGQRVGDFIFIDGFESGDTSAWTSGAF